MMRTPKIATHSVVVSSDICVNESDRLHHDSVTTEDKQLAEAQGVVALPSM